MNNNNDKRDEWNALFAKRTTDFPPESYLVEHLTEIKGPAVLDLACGDGRNALWLAGLGYGVTAVDFAEEGLKRIRQKVQTPGSVQTVLADLGQGDALAGYGPFNTVVINHYMPVESMLQALPDLMVDGGRIIMVSFAPAMADIRPDRKELILDFDVLKQNSGELKTVKMESFQDNRGYFNACILEKPFSSETCFLERFRAV